MTHKDYPNNLTEDFVQMVCRLKKADSYTAISYINVFLTGDISFDNSNEDEHTYRDRPLEEYADKVAESYEKCVSELFLNDGIPAWVQNIFGIRFSEQYNRVLIPIYQKQRLVGIFGRYNEKEIENDFIPKYFPILPYQKGKVLFPFDINGDSIRKSKFCYLVESEKTTMLCYKYGWKNVLALGGNAIKTPQIELLKELGVEKVILSLDKGLGDGFVEFSAMRLAEFGFDVYYIDVEKIDHLPNTDCVFDLDDKGLIEKTIREYIKKVV
ncbi:MAG: hypothetical protein ACRCZ0_11905 [Cetobacterium sp.]